MSEKVCIVILTVWIIGLAVAFISGISQDIKSAKLNNVYTPPTRCSIISNMVMSLLQIAGGIILLAGDKEMTGASGFGIVYLAAGLFFFFYSLYKLYKLKR